MEYLRRRVFVRPGSNSSSNLDNSLDITNGGAVPLQQHGVGVQRATAGVGPIRRFKNRLTKWLKCNRVTPVSWSFNSDLPITPRAAVSELGAGSVLENLSEDELIRHVAQHLDIEAAAVDRSAPAIIGISNSTDTPYLTITPNAVREAYEAIGAYVRHRLNSIDQNYGSNRMAQQTEFGYPLSFVEQVSDQECLYIIPPILLSGRFSQPPTTLERYPHTVVGRPAVAPNVQFALSRGL